jgi:LacI family transcriptional regulator
MVRDPAQQARGERRTGSMSKAQQTRQLNVGAVRPLRSLRVLVMVSPEQAFGRRVLEGIADYADHHGRWQHYFERQLHAEPILRGGFDGMIVAEHYHTTHAAIRQARSPVVAVTGPFYDDGQPCVVVDNAAVGHMGAEYLIDLGLRSIVYVSNPTSPVAVQRGEGLATVCRTRGVSWEITDYTDGADQQVLLDLARRLPDQTGVLACQDQIALHLARNCHLAGRKIPEEVAILGIDNETETCRLAHPPLSSIDHNARQIGYEAAKMLDGWLATGIRPTHPVVVKPVGVVARQSTDLLAVDDPDVQSAIGFIRSHVDRPVKVCDVLEHVAMARRSLEVRFRKVLGRSIHDEIMRVKIERAKHLLATSDWTMPHVAAACGFSLPSQLSFVFKRETGESPQAFRQSHRYSRF